MGRVAHGIVSALFLALCLASLASLVGCSEEAPGPDEGRPDGGSGEVGAGGSRLAVGGGGSADGGRYVSVEHAFLSSAGDADLMDARVRFGGEAVWPDCFLVDGPTMEAMEEAEEGGGRFRGRIDSSWADADSAEKALQDDGTLLVSFREDPGAQAPDPDRTPYFVYCSGAEGLGAPPPVLRESVMKDAPPGSGWSALGDLAHVQGTPKP